MRQQLRLLLHSFAINGKDIRCALQQSGFGRGAKLSGPPRLLFYAVNGVGLGHVTRLLGIARQVRNLQPDVEILFLTSSEAAHLIYRAGFAYVKTPSHSLASQKLLDEPSILRLNHHTALITALSFKPHCLVVDCFPAGLQDELLPLLQTSIHKVFVFRAQRENTTRGADFQKALSLYALILVPHNEGSESVLLPTSANSVWTGPMMAYETSEMLSREAARAALGLPSDKFVGLITLGGGGEAEIAAARRHIEEALQAKPDDETWVEVEGPLLRHTPESFNLSFPWRVLRDVHPLMLYLNAFDGAISATGYNTVQELQVAGVPTILWPFPRLLDDQNARAQQLAQAGRALAIDEGIGENRSHQLANALQELRKESTRRQLREAMKIAAEPTARNGSSIGAEAILKLLKP
jgi:predicted glycosyltransferase